MVGMVGRVYLRGEQVARYHKIEFSNRAIIASKEHK
jgi:hypothetical protein